MTSNLMQSRMSQTGIVINAINSFETFRVLFRRYAQFTELYSENCENRTVGKLIKEINT